MRNYLTSARLRTIQGAACLGLVLCLSTTMLLAQSWHTSVVAGNGTAGYSGDSGPATSAELYDPMNVAFDSAGNMFIADGGNGVVREVYASNGYITTIPSSGQYSFPTGIAVDPSDNIYIVDQPYFYETTATSGSAAPFTYGAGCEPQPYAGDDELFSNGETAADGSGNIYVVADGACGSVPGGIVRYTSGEADGYPTYEAGAGGYGLALDSSQNVVYFTSGCTVQAIDLVGGSAIPAAGVSSATAGIPYAVAQGTSGACTSNPTITGTTAALVTPLNTPLGVAVDSSGNVYIVDYYYDSVLQVSASDQKIRPIGSGGVGGSFGVNIDGSGNLYVPVIGPTEIVKLSYY